MKKRPQWVNPKPYTPGQRFDFQTPYATEKVVLDAINDLDVTKRGVTDPVSGSSLVGALPLSGNISTIEIDFGTTATRTKSFTVTDAKVQLGSTVFATQSAAAATGRDLDENEMDQINFTTLSAAGSFTLLAFTSQGPVVGLYKVQYLRS